MHMLDCEQSLILEMVVVGWVKYAHAKFQGDATRGQRQKLSAKFCACVFCPPHNRHRACVYFTRPTIAITEIRDYSQSMHVHIAGQCIAFLWKSGTL